MEAIILEIERNIEDAQRGLLLLRSGANDKQLTAIDKAQLALEIVRAERLEEILEVFWKN